MAYAVVRNGRVVNTIAADAAFISAFRLEDTVSEFVEIGANSSVGIGFSWDGTTFTRIPATPSALREAAKVVRAKAVDAITVTTAAGRTFDGDETSQGRMARAIVALQATGTPRTLWVLHDNTVIEASVAELIEALALAGAAQSALWVI